jgi:hypothetical protein
VGRDYGEGLGFDDDDVVDDDDDVDDDNIYLNKSQRKMLQNLFSTDQPIWHK